MRIIALPVARLNISRGSSTMLVLYHFDLMSPSSGRKELSQWHKRSVKNVMNKVVDLWTNLGKAPKGSWKLWTYELGERVADRIQYEELALKSVDPTLGPAVPSIGTSKEVNASHIMYSLPKIPLIYPPSLYPACPTAEANHMLHPALAHLRALLSTRGPQHRRGFYLWMFIAPFTLPIALIPIIPNLPLFFCVWRSWSHYRAYRASRYLSSLLDRRLIEPNPSIELDKLYTSFTSFSRIGQILPPTILPPASSENSSTNGHVSTDRKPEAAPGAGESLAESMFLTREMIPLILAMFSLPESAAVNMNRAVDQVRGRLEESA